MSTTNPQIGRTHHKLVFTVIGSAMYLVMNLEANRYLSIFLVLDGFRVPEWYMAALRCEGLYNVSEGGQGLVDALCFLKTVPLGVTLGHSLAPS